MRLVDEQDQIIAFPYLVYDSLYPLLEHSSQHSARYYSRHLELNDVGVLEPRRQAFRFKFYLSGQALDDRGLADTRLAHQHRRVSPFAMTQDFYHLTDLFVSSNDRRELVLASQLVQADAKMFQIWGKFIPAAIFFFLFLVTADSGLNLLHDHLPIRA